MAFYCNRSVAHNSLCVCSDLKIWASDRLREVKNSRKIQINSVESGHGRLREVSSINRDFRGMEKSYVCLSVCLSVCMYVFEWGNSLHFGKMAA